MEATIQMESEKYSEFIRSLATLKEICNDADIRGSIIRQRTNDKTSVFEMDMSEIFEGNEVDVALTNLKQKFELFKVFQGQSVTIDIRDDTFTFSDSYGELRFLNPPTTYVDNQFIPDAELESIFSVAEDDLIFSKNLQTIITDRIKTVVTTFNVLAVQVVLNQDKAGITAAAQSKDQWAKFVSEIESNMIFENSVSNLSIIPFTIDHDADIKFDMYKDPARDVALNFFSTTLGGMPIRIFSRSGIHSAE